MTQASIKNFQLATPENQAGPCWAGNPPRLASMGTHGMRGAPNLTARLSCSRRTCLATEPNGFAVWKSGRRLLYPGHRVPTEPPPGWWAAGPGTCRPRRQWGCATPEIRGGASAGVGMSSSVASMRSIPQSPHAPPFPCPRLACRHLASVSQPLRPVSEVNEVSTTLKCHGGVQCRRVLVHGAVDHAGGSLNQGACGRGIEPCSPCSERMAGLEAFQCSAGLGMKR